MPTLIPPRLAGWADRGAMVTVRLRRPTTWPVPDAELVTHDPVYGRVCVQAWHGLHPKLARRGRWADADAAPIVRVRSSGLRCSICLKPASRAKKTLWLWWSGPGTLDLDVLAATIQGARRLQRQGLHGHRRTNQRRRLRDGTAIFMLHGRPRRGHERVCGRCSVSRSASQDEAACFAEV